MSGSTMRSRAGTALRQLLAGLGVAAALAAVPAAPVQAQEVAGRAAIAGAGSTFAYPVLSRWAQGYRRWVAGGGDFPAGNSGLDDPPTAPSFEYEPIGSLAGIMRAREAAVDFGASDMPLASGDLGKLGLAQFPVVIGGVAVVVNIEGVGPGRIRFDGPLLAGIFSGRVRNWSDPAIRALNPELQLPDAAIAVVHRVDGSGTTFNFTDYLSKVSPAWREQVGSDLLVSWPVGTGARGNDGVARAVRQTANAIAYIDYANAVRNNLSHAALANRSGAFVEPRPASFQAAAAGADWARAGDFHLLLTDTPGEGAYPIVATVFVLIPKATSPRRIRAALAFFEWSLEKGGKDAEELGYVPLPRALVQRVRAYWATNLKAGG
ncbi:phosphate-binding protein PstS [Allostella vacuolata]|nr:phosphate-binding protein PstS [Stella vacuolata]